MEMYQKFKDKNGSEFQVSGFVSAYSWYIISSIEGGVIKSIIYSEEACLFFLNNKDWIITQ